jgi:hypothetical protein
MKLFIKILFLLLVLQSFQCSKSDDKNPNDITPEQLQAKKLEIKNYIASFSCSETVGCGSIAFGSKPCGGPREYLLFSNAVNLPQLEQMIAEFNELDNQYNIQTDAISDCLAVQLPTTIGCVNGVCTVISN